jgi:hypothetical protein
LPLSDNLNIMITAVLTDYLVVYLVNETGGLGHDHAHARLRGSENGLIGLASSCMQGHAHDGSCL